MVLGTPLPAQPPYCTTQEGVRSEYAAQIERLEAKVCIYQLVCHGRPQGCRGQQMIKSEIYVYPELGSLLRERS